MKSELADFRHKIYHIICIYCLCSDSSAEMRPRNISPITHRSRSPVGSRICAKYETQSDHVHQEEWTRPRRHHRTERDRDGAERVHRGHRRFDGGHSRRNKILPAPDYVANPSKWTKYELSDDGTEALRQSGMSDDQVNKFAAFQFLKELRAMKKREEGEEEEEEGEAEGKVVFRNPKKSKDREVVSFRENEGRSRAEGTGGKEGVSMEGFGSSGVLKMPEYVVGGGQEKIRGQRKGKRQLQVVGELDDIHTKTKLCVNLSHLADEEDD